MIPSRYQVPTGYQEELRNEKIIIIKERKRVTIFTLCKALGGELC
jgi:hypothetical protein